MGGVSSLSFGDAAGDTFGNTYIINGAYFQSVFLLLKDCSVFRRVKKKR